MRWPRRTSSTAKSGLRCARFLIYSAAELKEQHAPYGMESAMAKMYALATS